MTFDMVYASLFAVKEVLIWPGTTPAADPHLIQYNSQSSFSKFMPLPPGGSYAVKGLSSMDRRINTYPYFFSEHNFLDRGFLL
jgi:hypothetical protein